MDIIYLNDLRIETVIGIYNWERQIKQTVVLDLEMATNIRQAATTDCIEDTLNYKAVAKRLIEFIRWASDLKTMHRCCTSETRDCSSCKDGAAHMSWVMVNKRAHIRTTRDLQNWIEVYEMFAKLYQFIPW